jgi:hypothetical protein
MRENRTYGSEGGETGTTGLPYPYIAAVPTGTNLQIRNGQSGSCFATTPKLSTAGVTDANRRSLPQHGIRHAAESHLNLLFDHVSVLAATVHQFVVTSGLADSAVFDHHNHIGTGNRA